MYIMQAEDFKKYPNWLPLCSPYGIVGVNFYPNKEPNNGTAIERLEDFITYYLDLSTPNHDVKNCDRADFRLLDSFISEFTGLLLKVMDKAYDLIEKDNRKVEIQILLADPHSSFAISRAMSISDNPNLDINFWATQAIDKTKISLRKIAEAIYYFSDKSIVLNNLTKIPGPELNPLEEIKRLLQYIQTEGKKNNFNLELYFFSEVPSGPLFFLQNILIQGRFCYDLSSIKVPYISIVNNPACSYDFYDIFSLEFERLWNNSKKDNYLLPKDQDSSLQKKSKTLEESNNKLKEQIKELEKKNSLLIQRLERFEN